MDDEACQQARAAVDAARADLAQHPHGQLAEGHRWKIYDALGPRWEVPWQMDRTHGDYFEEDDPSLGKMLPTFTTDGHRRRVELAIRSVQQVLPLWEVRFPDSDVPHRALNMARKVMRAEISRKEAWNRYFELGGLWNEDSEIRHLAENDVWTAELGYGAGRVIYVALCDEQYDPAQLDSAEALRRDFHEEYYEDYDTAL